MGSSPFEELRAPRARRGALRRVDLGLWIVQVGTSVAVASVAVAVLGGLVAADGSAATVLARLLRALVPWARVALAGAVVAVVLGCLLASTAGPRAARGLAVLAALSLAAFAVLEVRADAAERVSHLRSRLAALVALALGWTLLHSHLARWAVHSGREELARSARACRGWVALAAGWVVGVDALDRLRAEAPTAGERDALGATFVVAGVGGIALLLLLVAWTIRLLVLSRAAIAVATAPSAVPPPAHRSPSV